MLKTATQIITWNCSSCIKAIFPFTELDDFELNRIHNPANNDLTNPNLIAEKLRQKFNFNDVLNGENEISNTINCDYYNMDDFKILCGKHVSKNCLSVFHSNISSLQGNFDKLELLITQLNDSHFCFDIISLTETWTPKSKEHLVEPKNLIGYQKYMGQSGTTMKSGCGFYIADHVNYIPRKDLDMHFYNQTNEFSCKWIELINKNKPNIIVASIYRHPSKNDTPFLEYLEKTLNDIKKENKYIMITGDFNFNLLKHDKNKLINEFLDIMLSQFCQPHIIYPTRIVDNAMPSLIDNIFF